MTNDPSDWHPTDEGFPGGDRLAMLDRQLIEAGAADGVRVGLVDTLPEAAGGAILFADRHGAVILLDSDQERDERRAGWLTMLAKLEKRHHGGRFPLTPLVAAAGSDSIADLARAVGVTTRTVSRWRASGLTVHAADRAAIAIGTHPAMVWPAFSV